MQINKLHELPHPVPAPKSQKLASTGGSETDSEAVSARKSGQTSEFDLLTPLGAQLRRFPEVRWDYVEAARDRLTNGEYKTQRAAAETALAILNRS